MLILNTPRTEEARSVPVVSMWNNLRDGVEGTQVIDPAPNTITNSESLVPELGCLLERQLNIQDYFRSLDPADESTISLSFYTTTRRPTSVLSTKVVTRTL